MVRSLSPSNFQDNRILAELEQPRTTGPSSYIMTSSALGAGAGMSSSISSQPPISLSNLSSNLASTYGTTAASFGAGGNTSYSTTASHNLSPLPIRANQISTMPPLCQVQRIFSSTSAKLIVFNFWLNSFRSFQCFPKDFTFVVRYHHDLLKCIWVCHRDFPSEFNWSCVFSWTTLNVSKTILVVLSFKCL